MCKVTIIRDENCPWLFTTTWLLVRMWPLYVQHYAGSDSLGYRLVHHPLDEALGGDVDDGGPEDFHDLNRVKRDLFPRLDDLFGAWNAPVGARFGGAAVGSGSGVAVGSGCVATAVGVGVGSGGSGVAVGGGVGVGVASCAGGSAGVGVGVGVSATALTGVATVSVVGSGVGSAGTAVAMAAGAGSGESATVAGVVGETEVGLASSAGAGLAHAMRASMATRKIGASQRLRLYTAGPPLLGQLFVSVGWSARIRVPDILAECRVRLKFEGRASVERFETGLRLADSENGTGLE